MKTQRFLNYCLFLIGLLLGSTNVYAQFPGGGGATNLPLIASTDFTVVGGEDDYYHSFDMQNDFGGIVLPTFSTSFSLPDSTASTATKSAFIDKQHYAITPNPIRLDSLRFYDNKDSGDWGVVISNGSGLAPKTPVFSMNVMGLKNNGNYKVVVEVCNPHSTKYLNTSGAAPLPHLSSGYSPALKIGVNNSQFGGKDARPGSASGSCEEIEITNPVQASSDFGPVQDNKLTINFYIQQMAKGEAIMIRSIKVYGELDPKISGPDEVCAGGESGILSLAATYQGCTYQWYCDGKAISGATGQSYSHVSEKITSDETHEYSIEVTTPDGKKIKSNVHRLTDAVCCTSDDGEPMSQKLIWQDDFGTFTGKGEYWIWDYKDINNPVKVKKTTKNGWTYGLSAEEEKKLAASYPADGIPYGEGTYSIAANVTCTWDGATTGTVWEWQAYTFNGKTPKNNGYTFAPDHTYRGSDYGAMLFLNCGNEPDATIYDRTITNLCNKEVTVKCYLNNWSASDNPTEVYIRITDLNSGTSVESSPIKRYSTTSGLDWVEVKKKITLTGAEPKMKFEIISKVGGADYNKLGNDLLLDDIQIWTCTPPSVQLYFDDQFKEDTTSCDGKDVDLFVNVTKMISNFYKDDQRYIFQYTTGDPEDNSTWKPVPGSKISDVPTLKDMSAVFEEIDPEEKLYFRVVLGSRETLEDDFGLNFKYNPNEACANYTVSAPIEALKTCPACTEPKSAIKIKSDKKGSSKKNKKDVVELCYGESVTLSQAADITPAEADWASPDFYGFAIKWFKDVEKPGTIPANSKGILNDVIDPLVIDYDDPALGGTEMPVVLFAVDAFYPDGTCKTGDTIYIKFNPVPEAKFSKSSTEFCEGEGTGLIDMRLTKGDLSDYTVRWWKGTDTLTNPLPENLDEKFFEKLSATEGGDFRYQLVDNKTGCKGDTLPYEVIVNPIPDAPKEELLQYTINGNSNEVLTIDKFVQTLDASYKLVWFNSKTEPNSKGSSSVVIDRSKATENNPYEFYIAYKDGDCYSERALVKVEVLQAPPPSVDDIDLCKDGTYDAMEGIKHQDSDYELVWFKNAAGDGESKTPPTDVVDTSTPGVYTLYVAQRATKEPFALSEIVEFNVTVYDVKEPIDASRHEYCANEKAEELKAELVTDEKNYYYADEIVFVSGSDEQSTFIPDTKKSTSQTYDYQAYQKFTTPKSFRECKGPSIDIKVDVIAVDKPKVNHSVSYVKSEAASTKEFVDILVKSPDAIEDVAGQTLLWSKFETGKYVSGSTPWSKPDYDELAPVGVPERQIRWVKWRATTASGLECESDPVDIEIIISSTPAPIVKKIEICEEVYESGSIPSDKEPVNNAEVNNNSGSLPNADKYDLVWFEDQTEADAAMTDASKLNKGKKTAPSLTEVFAGVDMSDETVSEWSKSLYVVQTYNDGTNVTTSPASEMKLVVNATPKLKEIAHEPVCKGPVNLTDNKYWNVSNGVKVEAEYSFEGSSVTQNASGLTKAGKYIIVGTSSLGCKSDELELQLDIRNLKISMDPKSETCPESNVDQKIGIEFSYNENGAEAKSGKVKLSWTSEEKTSDKPTQKGDVDLNDLKKVTGTDHLFSDSISYLSGSFSGKAGDTHTIIVKMTDGYCGTNGEVSTKQTVEIGNGPAGGTFTWSETGNESTENGKKIPLTDSNKDNIEINACGDVVTVDFSNVTMNSDSKVEWFKSQDYTSSPSKTGPAPTFTKGDYGKYYVRYTNKCYAYATVTIIDASVRIDGDPSGDEVKCENDVYEIKIEPVCSAGKPTRQWYKEGDLYANNSDGLLFSPLKKKDEGAYKVEYRYDGCKAELDVVDLKVKEYVKVDVDQYEMYEGKKSYIRIAGYDANVDFVFDVPSNDADIAALTAKLTDNASRNIGEMEGANKSFVVKAVDEDHPVEVIFESDDYCPDTINFQVLRDAKLVLKANVETAMCLNEEKPFTIDTIGTGAFRRPGAKLEIIATPENGTGTQEKGFSVVADTLRKNISPRVTTKYDVIFTYGDQEEKASITVVVYNFKVEPVDQKICSGEEIALKADVSPAGSKIEWFDEDKTTSLGENPGMLSPVFDGPVSAQKSQHKYWARPFSDLVTCTSSGMTPLLVDVYRPLEGEIRDTTICEGESVRVDAGSYGANTYTWIIDGDSIIGSRYYQDRPSETTVYKVFMKRGDVCETEDQATVTVTTKPVIASIDSVGYRDVDVIMDPLFGTSPFRYSVDGGEWIENTHLTGLKYTIHTITVEDANGCVLKDTFIVKDPALEFPIWFSPNNDGEFENWTVPGIQETYPEAEFTIYDRWGKKLVEFNGADEGWDGSYNGVAMPSTDYWYECIIREIDKVYKGHFTLIRR